MGVQGLNKLTGFTQQHARTAALEAELQRARAGRKALQEVQEEVRRLIAVVDMQSKTVEALAARNAVLEAAVCPYC